ncbi:MAG: ankyrin repeat domain-containing protein [Legionellaceae bacterium]|nr:ankyrin repeat domain-containing protein [Legionellaceae bacterium]
MLTIHDYLLYAARLNNSNYITYCLQNGAFIHTHDYNGDTPLHIAAQNNCLNALRTLRQYGANLEIRNRYQITPLMDAVAGGHNDSVLFLLNEGACTDVIDENEWNLLHWTSAEDHPTTADLVISHNPLLVNYARWNGITPLHLARSSVMANVLLKNGALSNAKGSSGETPLTMIAEYNDIDLIKCLVQYNANIFECDPLGNTAISIASKNRYYDIEKYLKNIINPPKQRKTTNYEMGVSMALSLKQFPAIRLLPYQHAHPLGHLRVDSLAQERIIEHARRRVDLFFYMLIAYYKTGLTIKRRDTKLQHGSGSGDTVACHSAILPSVYDTIVHRPSHQINTRYNPGVMSYLTSILDHTHLHTSLNSTVELHQSVNHFDSNLIEGKDTEYQKMRFKSIVILNAVSQGRLNPVDGMGQFLTDLKRTFVEQYFAYFNHKELPTSPRHYRGHIFDCQRYGSFENCHEVQTTMGVHLALNDNYIQLMLGLTTQEKARFQPQYHESENAFARRLHYERTAIYENSYSRIKNDMGLPIVCVQQQPNHVSVSSVSTQGMFSNIPGSVETLSIGNRHSYRQDL